MRNTLLFGSIIFLTFLISFNVEASGKKKKKRLDRIRYFMEGVIDLPEDPKMLTGISMSYIRHEPGSFKGWKPYFRLGKDGDLFFSLEKGGDVMTYKFPNRYTKISKAWAHLNHDALPYWKKREKVDCFHLQSYGFLPFWRKKPRDWFTSSNITWPINRSGVVVSAEPPAIVKVSLNGTWNSASVALLRFDSLERLRGLISDPFREYVLNPPSRSTKLNDKEKAAVLLITSIVAVTAKKMSSIEGTLVLNTGPWCGDGEIRVTEVGSNKSQSLDCCDWSNLGQNNYTLSPGEYEMDYSLKFCDGNQVIRSGIVFSLKNGKSTYLKLDLSTGEYSLD